MPYKTAVSLIIVTFCFDVLSFGTKGAKERTKENADALAVARHATF